jgi:hypothetical protein
VDAFDLPTHLLIAACTCRTLAGIGKAQGMFMIGGWGDRQFTADRLDTQVLAMGVDERHHHLPWRSSSAIAKYADALRKISLARRSSLTSRSSILSRALSSACALAPFVGSPPHGTSGAASRLCSQSCRQSRSSPPT